MVARTVMLARLLLPSYTRVQFLIQAAKETICSGCHKNGKLFTVGSPITLRAERLPCKFSRASIWNSHKATLSFSFIKRKVKMYEQLCKSQSFVISTEHFMKHHAQIAWRRLSLVGFYTGPSCAPINRIACVVSFSLSRRHLVSSVFSLIIGELVLAERASADAGTLPPKVSQRKQTVDHHISLIHFLISIFEGVMLLMRIAYLAFLFFPAIAMSPFAESLGPDFRKTWLRTVHLTLERAGPAFIKWGQWAASRPDLFPRDLCTELAEFHTRAPVHEFSYTKNAIEKAFGRSLSDIFEDFEEVPVASGSIAQVHRALLKSQYPGQNMDPIKVAVKVRHPSVVESIKRDFVIINLAAKASKSLPALNWLRLDESVRQFAIFMLSQVDLAREASHLSRFLYNFRNWKDVSFPKPLYPLVHPAVLVETYEQGESVSCYVDEHQGKKANSHLKSALAHIGTHALLKMLLIDNFIHADMHPGNILVRVDDGSGDQLCKSKPHVIFLDVGMTAELSKGDRLNLLDFFKAIAMRDGRTAATCTLKLSKQQACPNPRAFIEDVGESFDFWSTPEGRLVHPAECMNQLLEKVQCHKVNIDGNICVVMVTTLVLEGWQRKLDPQYNVMSALRNLLFKVDWAESLSYTIQVIMAP